jgi:hypothetical protein
MNYLMWGGVGFVFNKYIRDRYRGWWSKYNYVLSAALDSGLALATIVIFFALTMTKTEAPKWWGNNVVTSTLVSYTFGTVSSRNGRHLLTGRAGQCWHRC